MLLNRDRRINRFTDKYSSGIRAIKLSRKPAMTNMHLLGDLALEILKTKKHKLFIGFTCIKFKTIGGFRLKSEKHNRPHPVPRCSVETVLWCASQVTIWLLDNNIAAETAASSEIQCVWTLLIPISCMHKKTICEFIVSLHVSFAGKPRKH